MTQKKRKRVVRGEDWEPTRRSVTDPRLLETMLSVFIRNQTAYEMVKDNLKAKHLQSMGEPYAVIWVLVNRFYKKFGEMPPEDQLLDNLQELVNNKPDELDEDEIQEAQSFISMAYDRDTWKCNLSKSKVHAKAALDTCKNFLQEVIAAKAREEIYGENDVHVDVVGLFRQYSQEAEKVAAIGLIKSNLIFPDNWDKEDHKVIRSTGVAVLDTFCGGGLYGGEILLFMAPVGQCKTTLTIAGATQMAKHAKRAFMEGQFGDKRPLVYVVSTEMDIREFRYRILSNIAHVPRNRLARMKSLDSLSKAKRPGREPGTEYERKLYKANKGAYLCEYDRVVAAMKFVNEFMVFVDFTANNKDFPNAGAGGVQELSSIIQAIAMERKDTVPYAVWIDHAYAMAMRIIECDEKKTFKEDMRSELVAIPTAARDHIAKKWDIPVIITHQINTDGKNQKSVRPAHHSEAAEAKMIGMAADFCIQSGVQNGQQLCCWVATKHRREPPRPSVIVKIDGEHNRILRMSNHYSMQGTKIMSHDDMEKMGMSVSRRPKTTTNYGGTA